MDSILTIALIVYSIWAIYSGYKVVSGRSEYLDRKVFPNVIFKFVLSVIVGYVVGVIYFFLIILRLIFR